MRLTFILLFLSLFVFGSFAADSQSSAFEIQFREVESKKDWNEILAEAKNKNKLIFADAYTDWCGWCKELDEKVYTDADLASYFNDNFVNIKFNAESDFGSVLAEQMSITAYPTLLYVTPKGLTFEKIEGFVPVEALQAYADQAIENWEVWPSLEVKEKSGTLNPEDYLSLIAITEKMHPLKAADLANDYISSFSKEDYKVIENIWLLYRYQNSLDGVPYQFVKNNKAKVIEWHGETEYFDYISSAYNDNLGLAMKYGDTELMERIVSEVLPELIEKDVMPRAIYTTRSVFYAQREEFEKYHMEVNTYLNNHLSNESKVSFILSTSYEVLENYSLEENLAFLDKLLNLGLSIDEKSFEVTSLLGYVMALRENYAKANELLDTASSLATEDEEKEMVASLREAVDYLRNGN